MTRKRILRVAALGLVALGALGLLVAAPAATGVDPRLAGPGSGPAGLKWIGGNQGSEFMRPGGNCIACHQSGGKGPVSLVAGTVYAKLNEPDDDFGVEGAVVQLTDANGQVLKFTTNAAGNFIAGRSQTFKAPYAAKVIHKGAERAMVMKQMTGNCAMCHTSKGMAGAPGRVIIP